MTLDQNADELNMIINEKNEMILQIGQDYTD